MNIQHNENGQNPAFFIAENDKTLAEMVYRIEDNKTLIIEHTFVDEKLRGQNIGVALLENVAAFARKNNLRLRSECTYAHKMLTKNAAEFSDITE